jgi:two-component system, chemotaxis family, sensor kinase Cph1
MKLGDGLVTFLTDVTDQRRMEADLRSYAEVVAHDLREPVMAMALLVTLLERNADKPPPPDALAQLRACSDRARELIDSVLTYARAGLLQTERLALRELVSEVEQDLEARLREERATLEVGELPEVEADPRQLRRVLQNLIVNALKFRTDAPPRVELSAHRDSREWVVSVRDNGVGVDPADAGRIFGLFSRGTTQVEGAGIGLAMCRRIVEAHGGRIWVEAAEGGGSCFRFTLPRTP